MSIPRQPGPAGPFDPRSRTYPIDLGSAAQMAIWAGESAQMQAMTVAGDRDLDAYVNALPPEMKAVVRATYAAAVVAALTWITQGIASDGLLDLMPSERADEIRRRPR